MITKTGGYSSEYPPILFVESVEESIKYAARYS